MAGRDSIIKGAYLQDFFSGSAARIYIHDVWVSDVVDIQFQLTNNKTPIYGYNSEVYDAIAKGRQLVQGQFSIAFKENGYLNLVMANFKNGQLEKEGKKNYTVPKSGTNEQYAMQNLRSNNPAVAIQQDVVHTQDYGLINAEIESLKKHLQDITATDTYEDDGVSAWFTAEDKVSKIWETNSEIAKLQDRLVQLQKTGKAFTKITTPSPLLSKTQVLSGTRSNSIGVDDEDLAERIDDNLLGLANPGFSLDNQSVGFKDGIVYVKDAHGTIHPARPDELDFIQYTTDTATVSRGTQIGTGFKIYITYGNIDDAASEHTIHVINDVHINAIGQVVEPNGNPIMEVYTFIAKDMDTVSERNYIATLNEINSEAEKIWMGYYITMYEEGVDGGLKEIDYTLPSYLIQDPLTPKTMPSAPPPKIETNVSFVESKTEEETLSAANPVWRKMSVWVSGMQAQKKKYSIKLFFKSQDGKAREMPLNVSGVQG